VLVQVLGKDEGVVEVDDYFAGGDEVAESLFIIAWIVAGRFVRLKNIISGL
jgi:hypothetical protein